MTSARRLSILGLAAFAIGCDSPAAPNALPMAAVAPGNAVGAPHTPATGVFSQTAITSLDVREAGPNTFLDQTSTGLVSGTLSGSYTDELKVVIHPNGRFNAQFTIRCECTVAGAQGILHLVASDNGVLVSPTQASFAGRATITGGTGALDGLHGVLQIAGTVDLVTGLSTYTYSGRIH